MKNCPICCSENNSLERVLNGIELGKCENCSFVFANISEEENEKVNSGYGAEAAEIYEIRQDGYDSKWLENIARRFTKKYGRGKVLDVGCGNGRLLKFFKKYGWECYGVDLSPWSEKYAEEYKFRLFKGKVEEIDLEKESFDLVTSTSTLEHIIDPVLHIKRVVELIKPGGLGYFSGIPNYDSLSIKLGLSAFSSNTPPGHANYFTSSTIRKVFKKAGATNLRVRTYGIPELHRIRKFILGRRDQDISEKQVKNNLNSKTADKKMLANAVVWANYYLGKPFGLGDKIEVYFVK